MYFLPTSPPTVHLGTLRQEIEHTVPKPEEEDPSPQTRIKTRIDSHVVPS